MTGSTGSDAEIVSMTPREAVGKIVELDLTKVDHKMVDVDLTEIDGKPTDRADVALETVKVKLKTLGTSLEVATKGSSPLDDTARMTRLVVILLTAAIAAAIPVVITLLVVHYLR